MFISTDSWRLCILQFKIYLWDFTEGAFYSRSRTIQSGIYIYIFNFSANERTTFIIYFFIHIIFHWNIDYVGKKNIVYCGSYNVPTLFIQQRTWHSLNTLPTTENVALSLNKLPTMIHAQVCRIIAWQPWSRTPPTPTHPSPRDALGSSVGLIHWCIHQYPAIGVAFFGQLTFSNSNYLNGNSIYIYIYIYWI